MPYREWMRHGTWTFGSTAAGVLTLTLLAGCAASPSLDPNPSSGTPSSVAPTPLFTSDAEALAAAKKAYAQYLTVVDQVFVSGGDGATRLRSVSGGQALRSALSDAAYFAAHGLHAEGYTEFDSLKLKDSAVTKPEVLSVYLCEDVSHLDLKTSDGTSQVKADREPRTPFTVTFAADESGILKVVKRRVWSSSDFC